MFFALNPASGVPLYRQLLQQMRERILGGQLTAGTRLPSVRELSAQVGINPLTVAKVYQFLERDGLVESRRGLGTYVVEGVKVLSPAERRDRLEPILRQVVAEALHLQVSEADLQKLIAETFRQMTSEPPSDD